jgi:hypothetical protein
MQVVAVALAIVVLAPELLEQVVQVVGGQAAAQVLLVKMELLELQTPAGVAVEVQIMRGLVEQVVAV